MWHQGANYRMGFSGTGMGTDTGATGLVPYNGRAGEMKQINRQDIEEHLCIGRMDESDYSQQKTIGYILSLEGADSLVTLPIWILHMRMGYVLLVRRIMARAAMQTGQMLRGKWGMTALSC